MAALFQDVHLAELFEDDFEGRLGLLRIRHVELHGKRFAALASDFLHQRRQLFFVARGHNDFGAGFGQGQGDLAANAL